MRQMIEVLSRRACFFVYCDANFRSGNIKKNATWTKSLCCIFFGLSTLNRHFLLDLLNILMRTCLLGAFLLKSCVLKAFFTQRDTTIATSPKESHLLALRPEKTDTHSYYAPRGRTRYHFTQRGRFFRATPNTIFLSGIYQKLK